MTMKVQGDYQQEEKDQDQITRLYLDQVKQEIHKDVILLILEQVDMIEIFISMLQDQEKFLRLYQEDQEVINLYKFFYKSKYAF